MVFPGKAFDELVIGEEFGHRQTVTEFHLIQGAGLIGDFNPLHVDEIYARKTRFGGRILHGAITASMMSAAIGLYFSGTAAAMLEQNNRYKAAVMAGDTLDTVWTVNGLLAKPKAKGGIIEVSAVCTYQVGELVAESDGKVLLMDRAEADRLAGV